MNLTKIEWCDYSWNPVTGCYNSCPYCYARKIAARFSGGEIPESRNAEKTIFLSERQFKTSKIGKKILAAFPFGFTPTFHSYRLSELDTLPPGKSVFVCSMGDLFGPWIEEGWITKVFNACLQHPDNRFLFLTKYPQRYLELAEEGRLPKADNFWYGSTVTRPFMPIFFGKEYHTFVSVEPILESFLDKSVDGGVASLVDWAIIGAETGNRKDKVIPKKAWIDGIVRQFHEQGKPVLMKDSLKEIWGEDIIIEFPWEVEKSEDKD